MVVHTCNPSYSEGGDRKMKVQGQPWEVSEWESLSEKLKAKDWKCGSSDTVQQP
jgi:hypothetical protein